MVMLTVVMVGTCVVSLFANRLMKMGRTKSPQTQTSLHLPDHSHVTPPDDSFLTRTTAHALTVDEKDLKINTEVLLSDPADAVQAGEGEDDDSTETTNPTPTPTDDKRVLALLYPPGLMGGYRNQVIRLMSLVLTSFKRDIHALLLPSLMWTTQVILGDGKETWVPIPMDLIFDVDHWNTYSDVLPTLVEETSSLDCWTHDIPPAPSNATLLTREVLQRGFLTPIANLSRSLATREYVTNLRKLDVYPNVSDCQNPVVFGGGLGAGRLWGDYIKLQQKKGDFHGADSNMLKALRPKQMWRELAQSCVSDAAKATKHEYVALHARMELEMMDHACGKNMERNLTRLFDHVEGLVEELESVGGVFVAVSRSGIEIREGNLYTKFKTFADDNLATLNRVVGDSQGSLGQGLGQDTVVFECGQHLMDKFYSAHPDSIDYGSLLQSVVNFYIATEAKAFIGVRGSSYSTDIWTTRYHQGKGDTNYEYTKDGVVKLDNGGLPPMHTNCGSKKK
jgi:hypothetical protein